MGTKTEPTPGIAIYLRCSDEDRQTPERSFALQRKAIEDIVIPRLGLPVVRVYHDLLTGTNYNRADFQKMLAECGSIFSHIALYRVDRFGRDTAEGLQIAKQLRHAGVQIVPASNPNLDITTPDGWLLFTILLGLGEHEVGVLRLRTLGGMQAKLESGLWAHRAPDGYINVRRQIVGDKYEKWVEMDPERAPMIRLGWDLLLTGEHSLDQICIELDSRGCLRRGGKRWAWLDRHGNQITAANALTKIFHNEFYAGWIVSPRFKIERGMVRSQAGAIVTDAEFDRGLKILEEHNHRKTTASHPYLLQGMLYVSAVRRGQNTNSANFTRVKLLCTVCRGKGGGQYAYYFSRPGKPMPDGIYLRADSIESQIQATLAQIAVNPARIPAIREHYANSVAQAIEDHLNARTTELTRQISKLHELEKANLRQYARGKLSEMAFDELSAECRAKLLCAETSLSELRRGTQSRITDLDRAIHIMARMSEAYAYMEFSERKRLLRLLFDSIVVDTSGEILLDRSVLNTPFGYLRSVASIVEGHRYEVKKNAPQPPTGEQKGCSIYIDASTPRVNRTLVSASGGPRSIH